MLSPPQCIRLKEGGTLQQIVCILDYVVLTVVLCLYDYEPEIPKILEKITILIFVYETKIVLAFLSTLASVIINIGEWSEKYCVKWQKLLRTICRLAEISYKCHHKQSVQKNLSGFPNYRKIFQFHSWSKLLLSKWNDLCSNVLFNEVYHFGSCWMKIILISTII